MNKTIVWCRGRHMGASRLEDLAMGYPTLDRLGALPMMALIALRDPNVVALGFGTGASYDPDGIIESRWMHRRLVRAFESQELHQYPSLLPLLKVQESYQRLKRLLGWPYIDDYSKSTDEENFAVLRCANSNNATTIVDVTCGSHAARCVNRAAELRQEGHVPNGLVWSVVPDDMSFDGPTVVTEYPHRGDDPVRNWRFKPNEMMLEFFRIPANRRQAALVEISKIIARAKGA